MFNISKPVLNISEIMLNIILPISRKNLLQNITAISDKGLAIKIPILLLSICRRKEWGRYDRYPM